MIIAGPYLFLFLIVFIAIKTMSYEAKFQKAVEIVQGLPKDGPVKPTQDEQLYVRRSLLP